jgi:hypothetical protein
MEDIMELEVDKGVEADIILRDRIRLKIDPRPTLPMI